ncbi:MAG: SPOR domain-containing protein [Ignavibacteriaceae bacterium]|nr:SPOR domain-containing protein [Ignavibacteriaceae bacterium]
MKLLIFLFFGFNLLAQNMSLNSYLNAIKSGNLEFVKKGFESSKGDDSRLDEHLFLSAVLDPNGHSSAAYLERLLDERPNSPYTTAGKELLVKYYYSLGYYSKAYSLTEEEKTEVTTRYQKPAGEESTQPKEEIPEPKEEKTVVTESNTKKEEVETPAKEESAGTYHLQVISYNKKSKADDFAEKLKKEKYNSSVIKRVNKGKTYHIVIINGYKSLTDAQKAKETIDKKYKVDSIIKKDK